MSKLIDELKIEHQEIVAILDELQEIGIFSDKGIELLMSSKIKLLRHLEKEDKQLYPVLYEKAKTDLFLKSTLELFGEEMKAITDFVLDFYEKYSVEIAKKTEFINDISKFIISLRNRIIREEAVIFEEYEKIKG